MKLYYPKSHYDNAQRGLLFPLLKPFIKGDNFTDQQRIAVYGVSKQDFEFTDTLEKADAAILPMAWNYYVKTATEQKAIDFVKQCDTSQKKVLAYNAGGYRSQFSAHDHTLPPFITDPLQKYFDSDRIFERSYQNQPLIGFCGQANGSRLNAIKELVTTAGRNLKTRVGHSKEEPQNIISTSFLRASVLKKLQQSAMVKTSFILRKKYRAGVKRNKDKHKTTLEFYNNINQSDYIVCVRGAGNFSVRFYETLALGRIPVFINTDCSLPLDEVIPWKEHVVWVEYRERHQVAQKVTEFHQALSETDFIALQQANRNLWKDYLTLGGFFKTFLQHYLTTK
ncbi:exostosin family protein [uncultured Marixanthomonas sp.]|uniref:exostosin domain-containing protein n=1 Tax=uncultured Marixanthomonas sp. TaxID=757245 RepID=UPI0030DDDBE2